MLTLGQCRNSSAFKDIAGVSTSGQAFSDKVNEAFDRLMERGDFWNTVVPVFMCVFNGCFVPPRYVSEIRRVNICNRSMPVTSLGYMFLTGSQYGRSWPQWRGQQVGFQQDGPTSVYSDVAGEGRLVRAYARANKDIGKTVTIFGTDNNGQPLVTYNNDGTVTPGVVITLAAPFGSTSTFVRHIDYLLKDVTQDIVDVYGYNPSNNLLEDIGHYEPQETAPQYTRYRVNMSWPWNTTGTFQTGCCGQTRGVLAEVKLRYIPAVFDTDLILIDSISALKKMFISIRRENAEDIAGAKQFETDAIHELNRMLENHNPEDQFAATDNTLGPNVWNNQCF